MNAKHSLPNDQSWNRFWKAAPFARKQQTSFSKQRIGEILRQYMIPDGRVLDAGCGSGYFCRYFLEHDQRPVALDYSAEALALARQVAGQRVQTVQADLIREDLQNVFPEERFDLIFSDGLFEHFMPADQDRILQNMRAVLKERGFIVTIVPNRWSPWQIVRPFLMKGIEEHPFILSQARKMHERNGFAVVATGGMNVLPFGISPEFLGSAFGMLLYIIAKKH